MPLAIVAPIQSSRSRLRICAALTGLATSAVLLLSGCADAGPSADAGSDHSLVVEHNLDGLNAREIIKRLEEGGKGRVDIVFGNYLEFLLLNATDPNTEVDGEKSSLKTKHFAFSDPAVRQAMNLLVDRKAIGDYIYGRTGKASANSINGPDRYVSPNTHFAFDIAKANKLLDDAGWAKGSDGVRAKDGKRMHFVYQSSTNAPRQKTQAIVKQAAAKAGIEIELKNIAASVFLPYLGTARYSRLLIVWPVAIATELPAFCAGKTRLM